VTRVDRAVEAALPLDHDRPTGLDLAHDAAIARPKLHVGVRHELDHATDPHARSDPGGEETSTHCVHDHVVRATPGNVLPRMVESTYPFGEETVVERRTRGRAGGSFELDG
jgi:hypothetical protein